jgi:hypothetical protein
VSTRSKKLVLAVIDGLTPAALERGIEAGSLPALCYLAEHGSYARGASVFPSVTPVCLSSIATGVFPDGHGIPHLVWLDRTAPRVIEYGSSLGAMLATGVRATARDSVVELSRSHLSPTATTVFEALEDAGLVTGAINYTCYRARVRHQIKLPELASRDRWYEAVYGPRRFFFFNLYESDDVGTRLAVRSRTAGSVDAYAVAAGRWLVTRDGFDFLVYYLPDYDYASHASGPDGTAQALERSDACLARLLEAAGGFDEFLERYAILVCSDHGQSSVERVARLEDTYADLALLNPRRPRLPGCDVAITASNRAGMVYVLPGARSTVRQLALRLDEEPAADVVLFLEDGVAVARRAREELRFQPGEGGWQTDGDPLVLDPGRYPNGLERAWHALACDRAGEILVSATEGYELADAGGRHHLGGGSHGSLLAADSLVPMLASGFDANPLPEEPGIVDLMPLTLGHFGVVRPSPEGAIRLHA